MPPLRPVTVPPATVALAFDADQVPPGDAELSVTLAPAQTDDEPAIEAGSVLTVRMAVVLQPAPSE